MSTPDVSGAIKYYRSHYNQWCCLHWMLHGAPISDQKLLPCSINDVMTQISNDFQRSLYRVQCRQTLADMVRVPTRGGISVWQSIVSGVEDTVSYREVTKQPQRLIAGLPLLKFFPELESWFDIYTGPISCLIIPQTVPAFVFIRHLFLSLSSAVHWKLSPSYNE